MLVCTRQLEFVSGEKSENGQPGELPAWRDGAVLIKVRFEVERRVMREVSSANVPIVAGEAKK